MRPDTQHMRPEAPALRRGTNQAGMRAQNERLVLSLVRRSGPLDKSEIARMPFTITVASRPSRGALMARTCSNRS